MRAVGHPARPICVRVVPSVGELGHAQVVIRLRRDLRQVRDAQYLRAAAERGQLAADDFGHGAADARIDLVENHRMTGLALDTGRGHLHRQREPRQLAT